MDTAERVQKDAACSETDASEATRGNTDSHNISNIVEIESSSTSASHSTSVSTSSDIDNIPLNKIYENVHKYLTPSSSSTKHHKKLDVDTFEPMHPNIQERIINMG